MGTRASSPRLAHLPVSPRVSTGCSSTPAPTGGMIRPMATAPRNVEVALSGLAEYWSPRTIAVVNDYDVRVAKVYGEFSFHRHSETDEFFMVLSGRLTIKMEGGDVCWAKGIPSSFPAGRAINRSPKRRPPCSSSSPARRSAPGIHRPRCPANEELCEPWRPSPRTVSPTVKRAATSPPSLASIGGSDS